MVFKINVFLARILNRDILVLNNIDAINMNAINQEQLFMFILDPI